MTRFFKDLGVLRTGLLAFTALLVVLAPFAFADRSMTGWRLYTTIIVPALVPPMFFVFPLDMTMSRVKMDGATDAARAHHRWTIRINIIQMLVLFLAWVPFYWRLLDPAGFKSLFSMG